MDVIAIDVDVVHALPNPFETIAGVFNAGSKIVWLSLNGDDKIRGLEIELNIPHSPILTNANVTDNLGRYDTIFAVGEVSAVISDKDESLMLVYMMTLPCNHYVHYTGPDVFSFLTPPDPVE